MDMRLHWLKDCEAQGRSQIHLRPGKTNLTDYWAEHQASAYHVNIKEEFLTKNKDVAEAKQLQKTQAQTTKMLATKGVSNFQ
jgi:hypothetical protein